ASNPERLRYLARDNISNENTKAVIRYLLLRDKGQANSVVWPGVDYDGNSDEGKALLATPNGRATAWLLIDHGHQMDWRMKSRQLRVYIFSYAGEYCMLWDLEPQSPHTRSKREEHIKQHTKPQPKYSTEPHVKRAGKEDFDAAKKQGDIAYNEMQAAFDGVCAREVRDFDPSAFENGWTRKQDSKSLPDQVWQDVIKKVAGEGKAPTTETSFYVNLVHDKDFTNSQGQPVKYIKADVGNALYEQHYIPASSAIIVSQTRSPAYTVKKRLGKDAPSNQEINDKYVPPLNRWSDATWTLWKEKGGGNDLRYIGRDYIFNQQTESVMNYIFDQHGSEDHKFPGLDFGMDSDEGRALLGTPNGIGAARLLIDRASELGRRDVRIYIFEPEEEYPCMLVDMRPAQVQSRALDERNGNSTKSPGLAKRQKKSKRYNKNSGSALRAFARRDKARLHARAHNKRHDETSQTRHSTLIDKQQDQPKHRALINPHTESLAQSHPSGSRPVKRRYTGELESPHPAPIQHHDDNDDDWFQSHSAHHTSPLTRRDAASDYEKALCTGRSMWAKVMQAFDNPGSDAKPTLPITALDNGWSKTDNPKEVDPEWTQYFDLKLGKGKIPNAELVRHIMLDQNKDFQNSQGGDVNDYSGTDEAGTALYYTTYIPTISSIIVKNTVSPLHVLSEIFTNMGVAPPSTLEIAQSYVPPLARWSDVTWTVYASLCASQAPPSDPSKLRYIGRDSLINREAQVIIAYILQRHRGTVVVPFPGLEFGMDEEEGLALLGTPNGMGVGWLVRDRVAELGRRAPRVRVWTVGARAMMGWDLVPVRARPVVVPGG
ncbi:MAG: hypothetical protein L6R42_005908, partial [Xanthoria sp. 1 TBL-2021]